MKTTSETKAFNALDRVLTASKIGSWVIVDGAGDWVATVIIKKPSGNGSRVTAFVVTNAEGIEGGRTCAYGWADGFGYDKLASALDDLSMRDKAGNVLTFRDHCRSQTEPPTPNEMPNGKYFGWKVYNGL